MQVMDRDRKGHKILSRLNNNYSFKILFKENL